MMIHAKFFAAASFGDNPLDWLAVAIGVVVFGLLAVGFALVVRDTIRQRGKFGLNLGAARCTECGAPPPGFRKPANMQQMLWGGWTCAECGLELDKYGRPLETQKTLAKFAILKAQREAAKRERRQQPSRDEGIRGEGSTKFKADDEVRE